MPLEVVHTDEREPARERQSFRGGHPHGERADETGAPRHRHGIDLAKADGRLFQRLVEHGQQTLDVLAGRELGNDAPEATVEGRLRSDDVAADGGAVRDHRRGRLIAGGLQPEDEH